jgi:hypothetical protein
MEGRIKARSLMPLKLKFGEMQLTEMTNNTVKSNDYTPKDLQSTALAAMQ